MVIISWRFWYIYRLWRGMRYELDGMEFWSLCGSCFRVER